jgi:hypothetical protein
MPFVSTDNNNAIVVSHTGGTAGCTGATGLVGVTGARGADASNWAVGYGDPSGTSNFVDDAGDAVTITNGSIYLDNISGNSWSYSTSTSSWTLTGDNYAGLPGVASFVKCDVLINDSDRAMTILKMGQGETVVGYIPWPGTQSAGTPTAVEAIIHPYIYGGVANLTVSVEDCSGTTTYAEYDTTYPASEGEPRILSLSTGGSLTVFPVGPAILKISVNLAPNVAFNGFMGISFLHIR